MKNWSVMESKRFEKPETKLLHEEVISSIFNAFLEGKLKPGEKLSEETIGNELGVSRTPVRAAFQEMEKQGIVEVIPRKGAYVINWSINDFIDFCKTRTLLEGFAAELAAEKILPGEEKSLFAITEKMCDAAENGEVEKEIKFDMAFHKRIVEISKNITLRDIYESLELKIRMYMVYEKYLSSSPDQRIVLTEKHIPIAEAIQSRQGKLSKQLMEKNVSEAGIALIQRLEKKGIDSRDIDMPSAIKKLENNI